MIRVGIVGCGKVADKHAAHIVRIPDARLEAVCDSEPLMAEQLAERFRVPRRFASAGELLDGCRLDVVHITTPPQSHHSLASSCLKAGCHVYVEKPLTVTFEEARDLIDLARSVGRSLTVGHETLFQPVGRRMRRLIRAGYLGGRPVHIESVYCYNLGEERYAGALVEDSSHWVRRLPGGLLQNVMSHGLGKISEYIPGEDVHVTAHAFRSGFLERIGEQEMLDELRVMIEDNEGTTAFFVFSSQLKPAVHELRVFGPRRSLAGDFEHQTLIMLDEKGYKSYVNQFLPPCGYAKQVASEVLRNVVSFLRNDFHSDAGLRFLVDAFYASIRGNARVPISYRDILLTSRIMEDIVRQVRSQAPLGPRE